MDVINVMKTDIEQTCFCCPSITRLVVIEVLFTFPICDDCLLTLASVEYLSGGKVVCDNVRECRPAKSYLVPYS